MSKKAFFSVEYAGARETISKMAETELAMDRITKAIKEAKKAGNEDIYKQLRVEQEKLKKTSQDLRGELRNQTRDFEKMKYPKDSVIGMELEYSKLREQVRGLSADQRNSTFGRDLIRQADQVKSQILKVDNSIKDFHSNIGNYKSAFSGLGDILTGGLLTGGLTAAAGAVISFGTSSVKEFQEAEKAANKLGQVYRTTGAVVGLSLQQIQDDISKLEESTGVDGDAIADNITAPLLTFKSVRGEIFTQAQGLSLDLSKFFGTDMQSATLQLGKALEDPVKGIAALRRSGISFTKDQQDVIKSLVETGEKAKAQQMILDEVATQVGGQAEAVAKPIDKLLVKWGNLQERIGAGIVAIIEYFTPLADALINLVQNNITKVQEALGPVIVSFQELSTYLKENTNGWVDLSFFINLTIAPMKAALFVIKELFDWMRIGIGIAVTLGKFLYEKVGEAFNAIIKPIKNVINLFADKLGLTGAITTVKSVFDSLINTILSIPGILSAVGSTIKKVMRDLSNGSFDFNIKQTYNKALIDYNGRTGRGGGKYNGTVPGITPAALLPEPPKPPKGPTEHLKDFGQTGSITSLEHAYSALQEKISKTKVDSPFLEALIVKSNAAKKALDEAKLAYEKIVNKNSDSVKSRSLLDLIPLEGIGKLDGPGQIDTTKVKEEQLKREEELLKKHGDRLNELGEKQREQSDKRRMKEYTQEQLIWAKLKAGVELNEKEKLILKKQFQKAAIDLAQTIADGIFQLEAQEREQDLNEKLAAIDKEYDHKLKAAQGNSTLEEALKKDLEAKKLAIQKDAFEKDKKAKIAQALINAALAITAALTLPPPAGFISAALTAVATGFQIASIKRTKFAQGGFGKRGFTGKSNLPPDETGKRPAGVALFHENEYFSPDWQVERHKPLFNALENERLSYMRGFASGGFSTPPQFVRPTYSTSSTQSISFSDDDIDRIAVAIGNRTFEGAKAGAAIGAERGAYNAGTAINRNNERINSQETDF